MLSHLTMQAMPCRRELSSSMGVRQMQQGQILFAESILGDWMLCAEHESLNFLFNACVLLTFLVAVTKCLAESPKRGRIWAHGFRLLCPVLLGSTCLGRTSRVVGCSLFTGRQKRRGMGERKGPRRDEALRTLPQ